MRYKEIETKYLAKVPEDMTFDKIINILSPDSEVSKITYSSVDLFYAKPNDLKMVDSFLRLRMDKDKYELTYKCRDSKDELVSRQEFNIELQSIVDFDYFNSFLKQMGDWQYRYALPKTGVYARIGNLIVARYNILSDIYVEIEVDHEYSQDFDENLILLESTESKLGFSKSDRINASLAELYCPKF